MGQIWHIVNLDKQETLGCWGKFGEFFFSSLGDSLTDRLQRRVVPPPDPLPMIQTQPRTHDNPRAQLKGLKIPEPFRYDPDFEAKIITKKDRYRKWMSSRGRRYDAKRASLNEDKDKEKLDSFDWRATSEYEEAKKKHEILCSIDPIPSSDSGLATINALPVELLNMIFSFIEDYDDALSLGVTSSHFWHVGKKTIDAHISRSNTSDYWCGDRFICIGGSASDLPPHLQIDYLEPWIEEYEPEAGEGDDSDSDTQSVLLDERGAKLARVLNYMGIKSHREEWEDIPFPRSSALPYRYDWHHAGRDCVGKTDAFKPWIKPFNRGTWATERGGREPDPRSDGSASEWILRNLTKREYTREDPGPCGSLNHKLIVRSCWSQWVGSVCLDPEPEELYHGPWAGDRFDVVPIEDLEYVLGNDGRVVRVPKEEWRDVTDEIRRLLDRLVEAEYENR